ncbi:MAG: glycyl-radical enzyme activating protein [Candidatus Geothermincolia bacterium]
MTALPPTRPLILDIKGNSLDDGPGIRTVVFFKGCPLDCSWCHNPESKKTVAELSFDESECVGCGECFDACGKGALSKEVPGRIERAMCDVCGLCAEVCPSKALSVIGRKMDVNEVVREVEKDKEFFKTSGGGVTLSGGEPTLFMDYCSRLLKRLRGSGMHTIVETCGQFDLELFEEYVLPEVDSVFYDLKIYDGGLHRRECGVSNEKILGNFKALVGACQATGKELLPRIPLVPGITATSGNLRDLARFILDSGASRAALLQYNPLWLDKNRKLGGSSPHDSSRDMREWMSRAEVEACRAAVDGLELV